MQDVLGHRFRRRVALLAIGQLGTSLAVSACVPSSPNAPGTPAPTAPATPVTGAAPLPVGPPTPGGPPPTVVGATAPVGSPAAAPTGIPPAPAPAVVTITPDRRFDPDQMQVARGDTVRWRNASRNPQTVTDDPARVSDKSKIGMPSGAEPFDSGVINPGDTFTHAFTVAGDYQYVSLPFESQNMIGHVMVRN